MRKRQPSSLVMMTAGLPQPVKALSSSQGIYMMSDLGYIKIHRRLLDHPDYQNGTWVRLWLHMLLRASFTDREFRWKGNKITLKSGQFISSSRKLAEELGISRGSVERATRLMEDDKQLSREVGNKGCLYSVSNWDSHQSSEPPASRQRATNRATCGAATEPLVDHIQEGKKERMKREEVILPFLSDEFSEVWKSWEQHRREIRKPLKPTSTAQQLKRLGMLTEQAAIEMIEWTIYKGWEGLREPDEIKPEKPQTRERIYHNLGSPAPTL
jgi:DNA-binding transcriptional regulator YhcF (GntR family)